MGSVLLASNACYYRDSGVLPYNADYTIGGWIKRVADLSATEAFVFQVLNSGAGTDTASIFFNYPALYSVNNTGSTLSLTTAITTTTTSWQYWVMQRSGSTLLIRVDGTTVRTGTAAIGSRSASDYICIGHLFFGTSPLNAKLARLRMWTSALTTGEQDTEMNSDTVVKTSTLHANYIFANGALATDSSGNGKTLLVAAGSPVYDADEPSFAPPYSPPVLPYVYTTFKSAV